MGVLGVNDEERLGAKAQCRFLTGGARAEGSPGEALARSEAHPDSSVEPARDGRNFFDRFGQMKDVDLPTRDGRGVPVSHSCVDCPVDLGFRLLARIREGSADRVVFLVNFDRVGEDGNSVFLLHASRQSLLGG
eukprot:225925_1